MVKIFDGIMPLSVLDPDVGTVLYTLHDGHGYAEATGLARYFRAYDVGGLCVCQGTVSTYNADLTLPTCCIGLGTELRIPPIVLGKIVAKLDDADTPIIKRIP